MTQPTACLQLKPLHRLIKEKFLEITNVAFHPVPTNKEYYYCNNFNYEKVDVKNDSDDEISNPPSELVEFKEVNVLTEPTINFMSLKSQTNEQNMNPLFLHFICTLRYENHVGNTSVKVLPTCLGEIMQCLEGIPRFLKKSKLQITLDVFCLTLPIDVQNVIRDYCNKGLRTTSFCSDGFQPSVGSSVSESSFNSELVFLAHVFLHI